MKTERAEPTSEFTEVRQQINGWRETRTTRGRMSKDLWASAVLLAKEHGIWKTSQILGLSYDSLKKQLVKSTNGVATSPAAGAPTARRSGFVQIESSQLLGGEEASKTLVEISTKDGAKLTMHLASGSALDVATLVTAFRQRVR